jgi:putative two-component system response regulator
MKTHASLGYEMLKFSERPILKAAATIAISHHEKYDGSGYPNGLEAQDIHIFGRITALCDVFDALGSDRCYKQAWADSDTDALLKREIGKHFDPKLISLFFDNLDEIIHHRDLLKDV